MDNPKRDIHILPDRKLEEQEISYAFPDAVDAQPTPLVLFPENQKHDRLYVQAVVRLDSWCTYS